MDIMQFYRLEHLQGLVHLLQLPDFANQDYKDVNSALTEKEDLVKGEIISVIKSHTLEEVKGDPDGIRMEILHRIQTLFDSDVVFNVTFTKDLTQ